MSEGRVQSNSRGRRSSVCSHHNASRDERGQAFVELALVLPIFVLLLVGAAEIGRIAFATIEVSNAARAGVSYGAQNHATASDSSGIQTAAIQDGPDLTDLQAVATRACTCSSGTTITCANAAANCLAPSRIIEYVQVQTSAVVGTVFKFPGIPNSITLNGYAIMRVEQ
jgi:Flp pilus assembly protein TadG